MLKETIKLQLLNGLEARPAALFVQIASKYESHITVILNDKHVNAKSIMGMMSLGAKKDEEIEIIADGEDEDEALKALGDFLKQEKIN